MSKSVKSSSKNTSVISIRVDASKFEKLDNQLSNLAATSISSSGKLGITKGELLEQLLDDYLSSTELKDFVNRDFRLQTSEQNRRIDELTDAVNTLTSTVANLRNIFVLTLNSGDINATLSSINTLNSRAKIEQKSGANDFEFTTKIGADIEQNNVDNESDLIAAFEQITVSNSEENGTKRGIHNSGLVTHFGRIKEVKNIHKRGKNI